MLSYRHGFHAGNFADVFKHLVLDRTVAALLHKDKPIFYLDTHAAAGRYDLSSSMALRNREFETGVLRLWQTPSSDPAIEAFRAVLQRFNPDGRLRWYPGSPSWVLNRLRPTDRMIVCDLHPTELDALRRAYRSESRISIQHCDAYQSLKAFLPPKERRGLVLIDPAFELKDERARLLEAIQSGHKRWPTGVFLIWYPLLAQVPMNWFHRQLTRSGIRRIMLTELQPGGESDTALIGSGLLIINPPWQLQTELERFGPSLAQILGVEGGGRFHMEWLVGE